MPDPTHHDNAWICERHGERFDIEGSTCEKQDWDNDRSDFYNCNVDWRPLTADDDIATPQEVES